MYYPVEIGVPLNRPIMHIFSIVHFCDLLTSGDIISDLICIIINPSDSHFKYNHFDV
jgi:hypothetical protein